MATTKKQLLRAYDAHSNVYAAYLSAPKPRKGERDMKAELIEAVLIRGRDLICATRNASKRCGQDLIEMCERQIDRSAELFIKHRERQRRVRQVETLGAIADDLAKHV